MTEELSHIRGRGAEWPSHIPKRGWLDVFWRIRRALQRKNRVMLIAAGATFYLLLSLFPGTCRLRVGLSASSPTPPPIAEHLSVMRGILPQGAHWR